MKRLILLRHGEAESSGASGDRSRPLTTRGIAAAVRMGQELRIRGLSPDQILVSDALRAIQTLDHVMRGGNFAGVTIKMLGQFYLADAETVRMRCYEVEDAVDTLLLVGHNPGWSELAGELSQQMIGLETAEAAWLEKDAASWLDAFCDPGIWTLRAIIP